MADQLEPGETRSAVLFVNDQPLSDADRVRLSEAAGAARPVWPKLMTPTMSMLLIGGGALLVVPLVVALVTALSAMESDHDIRTMVAIGAPPSIRRLFLGVQTLYYTFFAALLAVPLAMLLMKM